MKKSSKIQYYIPVSCSFPCNYSNENKQPVKNIKILRQAANSLLRPLLTKGKFKSKLANAVFKFYSIVQ